MSAYLPGPPEERDHPANCCQSSQHHCKVPHQAAVEEHPPSVLHAAPHVCVLFYQCVVPLVLCGQVVCWSLPPCFISWTCCQVSQLCGPLTNPGKPLLIVYMLRSVGGVYLLIGEAPQPVLLTPHVLRSIAVMCIASIV